MSNSYEAGDVRRMIAQQALRGELARLELRDMLAVKMKTSAHAGTKKFPSPEVLSNEFAYMGDRQPCLPR